jgi:hypothetical protein
MSEEEPSREKLLDSMERVVPHLEIDVGGRSGGKNEGMAFDANARGIADKGSGGGRVEIGDVVGGMARGIEDVQ